MNSTKTAVILAIVAIIGIGALIYANRDKFKKSKMITETTTNE